MSWRYAPYRFLFEGYPFFAALRWVTINAALVASGFIAAYYTRYLWPEVIRFNEVFFGFILGFVAMCVLNILVYLMALDYIERKQRERGDN